MKGKKFGGRSRASRQNFHFNFLFLQGDWLRTIVQVFHFAYGAQDFQCIEKTRSSVRVACPAEGQNEPLPGWVA
jgi:hypothetical protein